MFLNRRDAFIVVCESVKSMSMVSSVFAKGLFLLDCDFDMYATGATGATDTGCGHVLQKTNV